METVSGHATFGPSSLAYKEMCPHFKNSSEMNQAAESGTRCHECMENPELGTGHLNAKEASAVLLCNNFLAKEIYSQDKKVVETINEIKLQVVPELDVWGTCDKLIIYEGYTADLLDWKFGQIAVEHARTNLQIQAYTLGVFKAYPKIKEVTAWLVAPNTDLSEDEIDPFEEYTYEDYENREASFTKYTYYRDTDVSAIEARIRSVVHKCTTPPIIPTVNPKACRWCKNMGSCKAFTNIVIIPAVKEIVDSKEVLPIEMRPNYLATPEDIKKALDATYLLTSWCSEVKRVVKELMASSEIFSIPGYSMRSRKRGKKLADLRKVVEYLENEHKASPIDIDNELSLSIKGLKKIIESVFLKGEGCNTPKTVYIKQILSEMEDEGLIFTPEGAISMLIRTK